VQEAAAALIAGMADGSILDRTGKPYKPSTRRSYEQAIGSYLQPDPLAGMALTEVRRADVQDYVDRLRKRGLSPSTIANKIDPLRVIFRRAMRRDEMAIDPTVELELPAVRGRRERIAGRAEGRRSSTLCPSPSARCGRPRSTQACAAANYAGCGGPTSTWPPSRRSSRSGAHGTTPRARWTSRPRQGTGRCR
jgi:hypothetical protein